MSNETTNSNSCEVDFYLLGESSKGADRLVCQLALMAWERNQKVFIITPTESAAIQLDELMWHKPEGRFLPHARTDPDQAGPSSDPGTQISGQISGESGKAPVTIGVLSSLKQTDVVINLCPEAVPQPQKFSRVLEIVPFANDEREASRVKYKSYRSQGITPRTQEINQ